MPKNGQKPDFAKKDALGSGFRKNPKKRLSVADHKNRLFSGFLRSGRDPQKSTFLTFFEDFWDLNSPKIRLASLYLKHKNYYKKTL